jgi:hypothetical protein
VQSIPKRRVQAHPLAELVDGSTEEDQDDDNDADDDEAGSDWDDDGDKGDSDPEVKAKAVAQAEAQRRKIEVQKGRQLLAHNAGAQPPLSTSAQCHTWVSITLTHSCALSHRTWVLNAPVVWTINCVLMQPDCV